jgi:hypothetical protein
MEFDIRNPVGQKINHNPLNRKQLSNNELDLIFLDHESETIEELGPFEDDDI